MLIGQEGGRGRGPSILILIKYKRGGGGYGYGLWPILVWPFGQKKAYFAVFTRLFLFWCPVVPLVSFRNNLIIFKYNYRKNPKKKFKKFQKSTSKVIKRN